MEKSLYVNFIQQFTDNTTLGITVMKMELLKNIEVLFESDDQDFVKEKMKSNFEYMAAHGQFLVHVKFIESPMRMAMHFIDSRFKESEEIKQILQKINGAEISPQYSAILTSLSGQIKSKKNLELAKLIIGDSLVDQKVVGLE